MKNTAFLGIDRDLLENPAYNDLDARAMMLYSLYADRADCSAYHASNGNGSFVDASGVFIFFANELAADLLHVSVKTITNLRNQLKQHGLISVVRYGLKNYKIYVGSVSATPANVELKLPWKNHSVQPVTVAPADWGITKAVSHWMDLKPAGSKGSSVQVNSTSTCEKNRPTSLSKPSLSKPKTLNPLNELNAGAGETNTRVQGERVDLHSVPRETQQLYRESFGFLSKKDQHTLHDLALISNADMVHFAVDCASGRKMTNPIAYVTSIIKNAIAAGVKSVHEMRANYAKNQEMNRQKYQNRQQQWGKSRSMALENSSIPVPNIKIFKIGPGATLSC